MKVSVVAVGLALALSGCLADAGQKAQASYINISKANGYFSCGATKIGERTAITAEHCTKEPGFLVEGQKAEKVVLDGKEHALVIVAKPLPGKVAKLAHKLPTVEDKLYVWGKPMGLGPLWRAGMLSGYVTLPDPNIAYLGKMHIVDLLVAPGDSGSGIWNEKGELVASVSIGLFITVHQDWSPMGYVPYAFTVEQWKEVI